MRERVMIAARAILCVCASARGVDGEQDGDVEDAAAATRSR